MLKESEAAIGCELFADNCESNKLANAQIPVVAFIRELKTNPQILRLLTLKQITIFERFSWSNNNFHLLNNASCMRCVD